MILKDDITTEKKDKISIEYNQHFFRSYTLKECAEIYLNFLPLETDGLLSTGTSGCSIASAMLSLTSRYLTHTYIRKEGEYAHMPFGGILPDKHRKYVIVDDFVSGGTSIKRILEFAQRNDLEIIAILVNECPKFLREEWLPIPTIIVG